MTLGPREVMRSEEIEGGPSGPANPIPDPESLDCGCGQLPCKKLAKYATRKLFIILLCWIGFIQSAGQEYFYVTSSTIARKFQLHPNTIEWLTIINNGLFPFILALPVSYWGDRIHRAAWIGALVLIQSVGYLFLVIPHINSSSKVIEGTNNVTHLSLFAGLARLVNVEIDSSYFVLGIVILSQVVSCMGNVGFYSLGISYLDDNTRKRHVPIPLGFIIAFRIMGILFGYILGWACLRIDADNLSKAIESYQENNGAWWLGWPILAVLLALPGLPMSWFPRRLPSEVVEQAAASILDSPGGRTSPLSESTISDAKNVGDTKYLPSMLRLFKNKILLCSIFSSIFCITGIINFLDTEDIILESRFYAPRPSGLFLAFGDPLISRTISRLSRPILISITVILSGLIISKLRPRAKWLVCYNIGALIIASLIIFYLAFVTCNKTSIVGSNSSGSVSSLLRYCNKDCRCSRDANFQPVCNKDYSIVFYTPCHAGCTGIKNTGNKKIFTGCNCIEEITGLLGNEATQGPCVSTKCQIGWIVFEISTILAYMLIASCAVSSLLIGLRSTYLQDKSLAIGLWISLVSIFVYVPGKMLYWKVANSTCIYHGNSPSLCHLYDSIDLGAYLAYITTLFLLISFIFELAIFFICQRLRIYREIQFDTADLNERTEQIFTPLTNETINSNNNNGNVADDDDEDDDTTERHVASDSSAFVAELAAVTSNIRKNNETILMTEEPGTSSDYTVKTNGPLKYGPVGPGNPRTTSTKSVDKIAQSSYTDDTDDDDHINNKRGPMSLMTISYKRLEINSDSETSDSSPGSRHRNDYHKQSISKLASIDNPVTNNTIAGFSKTNDIEFTKWDNKKKDRPYTGDFNEIGIPIINYNLQTINSKSNSDIIIPKKLRNKEENYQQIDKGNFLINDDTINQRTVSPIGHTSSGFGSFASDLQKITTESKTSTPALDYSGSETSNSIASTSKSKLTKVKKPTFSTAL
ncbi:solute carrier organic anion transporter family member 1A5-like isoform X2 [Aphidius gifuensis]|uniref:solute carrier organic anion transporter family member 1A5-like isoform X2 n=1 Tax=Aphidius gifuensis TaxID=684658 RepID=UPI001CDD49C8|nr:solute carrier organic anion transporter family member 1A5-like isoform X2 [Aphidius gifuensis]